MATNSDGEPKKRRGPGKPFVKGDPRCWRYGTTSREKRVKAREAFEPYFEEGVLTLVDAMRNGEWPIRVSASKEIICRVIGPITEKLAFTDAEGNDLPNDAEPATELISFLARLATRRVPGAGNTEPK